MRPTSLRRAMFSAQTLARRLLYTMLPWYLLLALSMTGVQLAIQYYSVSRTILRDLNSLGRTVAPTVTDAVWELDTPRLTAMARGFRQHAIITGVRIENAKGETLVIDGELPPTPADIGNLLPNRYKQEVVPLHYQPVKGGKRLIGYLKMYSGPSVIWERTKYSLIIILLTSAILTGGLWLIFLWAIRFRLSDAVTHIARKVAGWEFQTVAATPEQITYPYHDELGALVTALNDSRERQLDAMQALNEVNLNLEHIVTERTQELQLAKNAAEAASRAKGSFLANMSHEIRTPMNAIMGLTHLVLEGELGDKQRSYLEKVQTSSAALLALLNDILDYSKIEAGRMDLERNDFQLERCLRNVSDLFVGRIGEKGLELIVDIDPEVPRWVAGDALRLEQVLNNLVGNAIKFTEAGEIHLRVAVAERSDSDILLQFTVKDTGIGMAPEQLQRLFQAFSQADTSITRKFGGSGLGLAICRHLVQLMGGEIDVVSAAGGGSTFRFTSRFALAAAPAERLQPLRRMKVLVVDDQETSRGVLHKQLAAWDFDVSSTDSGEAALQRLLADEASGKPFELVVLDWSMPGMSGQAVREAIGTASRDGRLRLPALLVMVNTQEQAQCLQTIGHQRQDTLLVKPVVPSALFDAVLHIQEPDLARAPATGSKHLGPRETLAQIRGASILLVEDNALNQEVAREFLSKAGLLVSVANNGQQAVEMVKQQRYDAVLMDLHMPVLDGLQATRIIRSLPQGQDLPILAMTAAAMPQDRIASVDAGMNGHITKPVDPQELANRLVEWIKPRGPLALQAAPSGAADDSDTRTLALALPHVAVRTALARLHGNTGLYRDLLSNFCTRHLHTADKLLRQLAQRDYDGLFQTTHELKGEAGNLGLNAVHAAADELGRSIKDRHVREITELAQQLASHCVQTLASLGALAPVATPAISDAASAAALPEATLLPLFSTLQQQLRAKQFAAIQTLGKISPLLADTPLAVPFKQVARLTESLNYDGAQTALKALLDENGWVL